MIGVLLAVVFVMVVALGALGGYLLVAIKRRIDEDRELDDANLKKQSDALLSAKGDLGTQLTTVAANAKKVEDAQAAANGKVVETDTKVVAVEGRTVALEGAVGANTTDIETERVRLNTHIAAFNTDLLRLDSVDTELGNRVGELEELAPVVRRLTIEEDGINVCGFNSSAAMCKKIKFAAV